jgi:hypothetical protein
LKLLRLCLRIVFIRLQTKQQEALP